ncbi:Heterokaryon incompatibility protein [Neofusicoccum parvum]|nr:Heterokaryon incompatibility protein [Neofusicoccum parvum]
MMIPIYQLPVPVSSTFQHRPLDRPRQFRLLRLHPGNHVLRKDAPWLIEYELVHVNADDPPPYEAVSYARGGAEHTQLIRTLPTNRTIAVTETVAQLLSRFKKSSSTGYLWIDQLCINQDNELERNHQVAMMGEIYSKAQRTLVWLGEADTDSNLVLGTLDILGSRSQSLGFRKSRKEAHAEGLRDAATVQRHLEDMFPSTCSIHSTVRGAGSDVMDMDLDGESDDEGFCHQCVEETALDRFRAACRLLSRPWFSRCWIAQEVLLAKEVHLTVGDLKVTPNDLHRAVHANLQTPRSKLSRSPTSAPGLRPLTFFTHFWDEDSPGTGHLPSLSSLLTSLRAGPAAGHLRASDPRDHVYAFLGLHGSGASLLPPRYALPVAAVYAAAARAVVRESRDLSLLGLCGPPSSSPGLPSWVPDWSAAAPAAPLLAPGRATPYAACGRHGVVEARWEEGEEEEGRLVVAAAPLLRVAFVHPADYPRADEDDDDDADEPHHAARRDSQTPDYLELGRTAAELGSGVAAGRLLGVLCGRDGGFADDYQYAWRERAGILRVAAGRRVARVEGDGGEARLALVPRAAAVGDEVWLVRGCAVPVVVRAAEGGGGGGGGRWRVVGVCFVEGVMDGEEAARLEGAGAVELV